MTMSVYISDLSSIKVLNAGIVLVTTLIAAHAFYIFYLHPLSRIPGPPLWALSRVPYAWTLRNGHFAVRLKELHAKYGSIVRIAANEVSFISQEAWDNVFSYKTNFPKSPHWYRPRPNGSWGIMTASNPEHGRFRRTFAPAFTEKAVEKQESMVLRHIDHLIVQLKKEATTNNDPTNFLKWIEYITFDILGDLCFSESFDCIANSENRDQIEILQASMKAFTYAAISRVFGVEVAWKWIASKVNAWNRTKFIKSVNSFTQRRLAEGDTADKNDLMTFVCRRTDGKGLTIPEADNSLGDMMIAGSETVATTLAALFHNLIRDSHINQLLTNEIRQNFKDESDINGKKLSDLSYLNAVVQEAMRLGPSLPATMPRIVPEPGAYVCGYWFPSRSLLTFSQLAAYSSPTNFSSPDKFIPSRWLRESSLKTHKPEVFHPFSLGPRNCIGREFALVEVKLIVAKLLWNFDVNYGGDDWEWNSQKTNLIWEKKPLHIRLSQRNAAEL